MHSRKRIEVFAPTFFPLVLAIWRVGFSAGLGKKPPFYKRTCFPKLTVLFFFFSPFSRARILLLFLPELLEAFPSGQTSFPLFDAS